jgi:hypothetical protein
MGHSSPTTTMGYIKVADEQKVIAAEKLSIKEHNRTPHNKDKFNI